MLRDILVRSGWREGPALELHWVLMRGDERLYIPIWGDLVGQELLEHCLDRAGIGPRRFAELHEETLRWPDDT